LSHEKIADEHSPVLQNMLMAIPPLLVGLIMLGSEFDVSKENVDHVLYHELYLYHAAAVVTLHIITLLCYTR